MLDVHLCMSPATSHQRALNAGATWAENGYLLYVSSYKNIQESHGGSSSSFDLRFK